MMDGALRIRARGEEGFTLIELLVVIVIIAILAAIAVPIFLSQREKAYISNIQSALKNASIAAESWAVQDKQQSFIELDEQDGSFLADEGFEMPFWAQAPGNLRIEANDTEYCIQARYNELAPDNTWRESTYQSSVGRPKAVPNVCPEL